MSHFGFIKNKSLKDNLDVAFDHILTLIPLSTSNSYSSLEKSSFRKTIIIYTASIVEAILFNLVCEKCKKEDLTSSMWELNNFRVIYKINDKHKIVAGDYVLKSNVLKLDKINLGIINKLLYDKKLIDKSLYDKVDQVRLLRNEQHFGTHQIVKEYTPKDLEFVFSIAKDVKLLIQK